MNVKLKRALQVLGGVVVLAASAFTVRFYVLAPKVRPAPEVKAPTDAESIARGKYLVEHVTGCVSCHSEATDAEPGQPILPGAHLGAGRAITTAKQYPTKTGGAIAPNITPSKAHGIGSWSDGEVLRAMREGAAKDGRTLFKLMPYSGFRYLSDEDALDIIAYVRTLEPSENDPGPITEVKFPVSAFMRLEPQPVEHPTPNSEAHSSDPVVRGNYLLHIGICHQCHDGMGPTHTPIPGKELSGGGVFHFEKGTIYAANITSDQATGIGAYSDEDIIRAVQHGQTKSGRPIYLMLWHNYAGMTPEDMHAIIAALRASKPITNMVPPPDLH